MSGGQADRHSASCRIVWIEHSLLCTRVDLGIAVFREEDVQPFRYARTREQDTYGKIPRKASKELVSIKRQNTTNFTSWSEGG